MQNETKRLWGRVAGRRNRYAVRERREKDKSETEVRRYKVYFKQFSRELWQKVRSFTQERYSRLEKEGDRRRGTQGSKEGVRRVKGESMRQREIAEESAAVGAHGSTVLLLMPSLRGQTLQWEQLMYSCSSSHSLSVALFLSCVYLREFVMLIRFSRKSAEFLYNTNIESDDFQLKR